jgi:hypothetical protein
LYLAREMTETINQGDANRVCADWKAEDEEKEAKVAVGSKRKIARVSFEEDACELKAEKVMGGSEKQEVKAAGGSDKKRARKEGSEQKIEKTIVDRVEHDELNNAPKGKKGSVGSRGPVVQARRARRKARREARREAVRASAIKKFGRIPELVDGDPSYLR